MGPLNNAAKYIKDCFSDGYFHQAEPIADTWAATCKDLLTFAWKKATGGSDSGTSKVGPALMHSLDPLLELML
jgi:hypothetical protein